MLQDYGFKLSQSPEINVFILKHIEHELHTLCKIFLF